MDSAELGEARERTWALQVELDRAQARIRELEASALVLGARAKAAERRERDLLARLARARNVLIVPFG